MLACILLPQDSHHAFLYINPLFRIVDFIIGMWLFVVIKDYEVHNKLQNLTSWGRLIIEIIVFVVCCAFIIISLHLDSVFSLAAMWWLPSIIVIAVFYLLEQYPGPITRILQYRHMVTLGSISYAFYLIHISVLVVNNHLMSLYSINYILDGVLTLCSTIVLAYLITYYFEPLFKKEIAK